MGLSRESKLKDVLADPKAREILDSIIPGTSTDPKLALMGNVSIKTLVAMSRGAVSQEKLEELDKALKALG